jgi:hypothetical protein
MNSEVSTISITRYRDKDGLPTCAINFKAGAVCKFLTTDRFGTAEICGMSKVEVVRRDEGKGYLIPTDDCIIWADEARKVKP